MANFEHDAMDSDLQVFDMAPSQFIGSEAKIHLREPGTASTIHLDSAAFWQAPQPWQQFGPNIAWAQTQEAAVQHQINDVLVSAQHQINEILAQQQIEDAFTQQDVEALLAQQSCGNLHEVPCPAPVPPATSSYPPATEDSELIVIRKDVVKLMREALEAFTQVSTRMRYSQFKKLIALKHDAAIVGWPGGTPFKAPGHLRAHELRKVQFLLVAGEIRFTMLDSEVRQIYKADVAAEDMKPKKKPLSKLKRKRPVEDSEEDGEEESTHNILPYSAKKAIPPVLVDPLEAEKAASAESSAPPTRTRSSTSSSSTLASTSLSAPPGNKASDGSRKRKRGGR